MCFGAKQDHKENPLRRWSEWWEPGARARLGIVHDRDLGMCIASGYHPGRVDGDTRASKDEGDESGARASGTSAGLACQHCGQICGNAGGLYHHQQRCVQRKAAAAAAAAAAATSVALV